MMLRKLMQQLCLALLVMIGFVAHAEDVLEVETEMEDAFQDSEAAQLEARDAKARAQRKAAEKEAMETKARAAIQKANGKEAEAKAMITASDAEIQRLTKQIAVADEQIKKSVTRYRAAEAKMKTKQAELNGYRNKLQAREQFLEEQGRKTNETVQKTRQIEQEIMDTKDRMAVANENFQRAKKEEIAAQQRLKNSMQRRDSVQKSAETAQEAYMRELNAGRKRQPASAPK